MESRFQGYHELDFTSPSRNSLYWHFTVPRLGEEGQCWDCSLSFLIKGGFNTVTFVKLELDFKSSTFKH